MRSRWKNDFVSCEMWACVRLHTDDKKKKKIYKQVANSRATTILPAMNGTTFWVHNGRIFRPVEVKPFMFGTKLGNYVPTSTICVYRRRKNKKSKQKKVRTIKKSSSKKK